MINNIIEFWCLVASGGLEIWVSWISFQKSIAYVAKLSYTYSASWLFFAQNDPLRSETLAEKVTKPECHGFTYGWFCQSLK